MENKNLNPFFLLQDLLFSVAACIVFIILFTILIMIAYYFKWDLYLIDNFYFLPNSSKIFQNHCSYQFYIFLIFLFFFSLFFLIKSNFKKLIYF